MGQYLDVIRQGTAAPNAYTHRSILLLRSQDLWELVFAPALSFFWIAVGMSGVQLVWLLILFGILFRQW